MKDLSIQFKNLRIINPFEVIENGSIFIKGQKIIQVEKTSPNQKNSGDKERSDETDTSLKKGMNETEASSKKETSNKYLKEKSEQTKQIVFNLKGFMAIPGLIDIHGHGGGGKDFSDVTSEIKSYSINIFNSKIKKNLSNESIPYKKDRTYESDSNALIKIINQIISVHLKNGTTILIPTLISSSPEDTKKFLNGIKTYYDFLNFAHKNFNKSKTNHLEEDIFSRKEIYDNYNKKYPKNKLYESSLFTNFFGVNLEGPFISKEKRGVHSEKFIRDFSEKEVNEWLEIFPGGIKIMTIAPEKKGAEKFIKFLLSKDIIPAFGHSNADYNTVKKLLNSLNRMSSTNPINHIIGTHLFNAMRAFHHREPGIVAALLENENVFVEVIPDLIHLHPFVLKLIEKLKGVDKILFVSDSSSLSGISKRELQKISKMKNIVVKDGAPYDKNGNLYGSIITLLDGAKKVYQNGLFTLQEIVKMISLNQAKILKIEDSKGSIENGKDADFLIIDSNLNVLEVFIRGIPYFNYKYLSKFKEETNGRE